MCRILIGLIFVLCSTIVFAQTKKNECKICKGSSKVKCIACKGEGEIRYTCPECNGEGEIKCNKCDKGNAECFACVGKGKLSTGLKCKICGGDGKISCIYCKYGKYGCFSCSGEKKISFKCRVCKGNKMVVCLDCYKPDDKDNKCIVCQDKIQISCVECEGKGKKKNFVMCETCLGRGVVICPDCNGFGFNPCSFCLGAGKIPKYDSKGNINVSNSPPCEKCNSSGKSKCKKCKGTGVQKCSKCNGERFMESTCMTCGGKGVFDCVWHSKNFYYSAQPEELKMKFDIMPWEFVDPTSAQVFYSLAGGDDNLKAFVFSISNNRDDPISIGDEIRIVGEMENKGQCIVMNEYIGRKLKERDLKFLKSMVETKFPVRIPAKSSHTIILVFQSIKSDNTFIINEGQQTYNLTCKNETLTPKMLKEFQAILVENRNKSK